MVEDADSKISWAPLFQTLALKVAPESPLADIVAPFIQSSALKTLLGNIPVATNLRVLTRWNESDLASGISDPEAFQILQSRSIPLYINRTLHSKIYVQNSRWALIGSGNLTDAGLGLLNSLPLQTETAVYGKLNHFDCLKLDSLFSQGALVTSEMYEQACSMAGTAKPPLASNEEEPLYPEFNLADLPLTADPNQLWDLYRCGQPRGEVGSADVDAWRDILHLQLPLGIKSRENFFEELKSQFLNRPTIFQVLEYIRENTPIGRPAFNPRYEGVQNGAIRTVLKDLLPDEAPSLPQRVNNLQNWLPFCKPEIEVNVTIPGRGSSRVFAWRDTEARESTP